MEILVGKELVNNIKTDELHSLDLRNDLANNNIFACFLIPQGYIGNRPPNFVGEHEDDTWGIDVLTEDGNCVTSYLYVSELEYDQDLKKLKIFE